MLLKCGIGEDFESPLGCREIQPVHPKGNQSWIFIGRTYAETEAPVFWPHDVMTRWGRAWCWERLKAGGEAADRGWDGWVGRAWVWANSGSWWWAWKPGVLQSVGLQRVGHNWATELNWTSWLGIVEHSIWWEWQEQSHRGGAYSKSP